MDMTEMNELQAQRLRMTATVVATGLQLLSQRALTVLALLLDAGIFGWAMQTESWVRLAGAAAFGVASWCVIHLRPKGESS